MSSHLRLNNADVGIGISGTLDLGEDISLKVGNGKVYVIFFDAADYPNLGDQET